MKILNSLAAKLRTIVVIRIGLLFSVWGKYRYMNDSITEVIKTSKAITCVQNIKMPCSHFTELKKNIHVFFYLSSYFFFGGNKYVLFYEYMSLKT